MGILKRVKYHLEDKAIKLKNSYIKTLYILKSLNDNIDIKIESYDKIDDSTSDSIDFIFKTVFNRTLKENESTWARPNWIGLLHLNEKPISFCYIVDSKILFDNKLVRVGGLGGVMTLPSYRGLGAARELLKKVDNLMFQEIDVDCGLLVCDESLEDFYNELDWYKIDCPVYYLNNNERVAYHKSTMLKNPGDCYSPNVVNIMGKLW